MRAFDCGNEIPDGRIVPPAAAASGFAFLPFISPPFFRPDECTKIAPQTLAPRRSFYEVRRRPGNVHTSIPPFQRVLCAPLFKSAAGLLGDAPALSGCNTSGVCGQQSYVSRPAEFPGQSFIRLSRFACRGINQELPIDRKRKSNLLNPCVYTRSWSVMHGVVRSDVFREPPQILRLDVKGLSSQ